MILISGFVSLCASGLAIAQTQCPGYAASNVQQTEHGLTAELFLAGAACDLYGIDLPNLTITVEYQSGIMIADDRRCCCTDS